MAGAGDESDHATRGELLGELLGIRAELNGLLGRIDVLAGITQGGPSADSPDLRLVEPPPPQRREQT